MPNLQNNKKNKNIFHKTNQDRKANNHFNSLITLKSKIYILVYLILDKLSSIFAMKGVLLPKVKIAITKLTNLLLNQDFSDIGPVPISTNFLPSPYKGTFIRRRYGADTEMVWKWQVKMQDYAAFYNVNSLFLLKTKFKLLKNIKHMEPNKQIFTL